MANTTNIEQLQEERAQIIREYTLEQSIRHLLSLFGVQSNDLNLPYRALLQRLQVIIATELQEKKEDDHGAV